MQKQEISALDTIIVALGDFYESTDPAKFPNDLSIQETLKCMRKSHEDLMNQQRTLVDQVQTMQANCPHEKMLETKVWDRTYTWGRTGNGANILAKKTCEACKKVEHRPKGQPWTICYLCWAPMKDEGREPGQSGHVNHYECTECGHHVETT